MALADRYQEPDTRTRFEKWLDNLNAKNRATVEGWLRDGRLPIARVVEWVRDDDEDDDFTGIAVTKATVSDWRTKHGVKS